MELNLKILAPLLQCTSIYRCALFITSKNDINFLFCVHITFFYFLFFLHFILRISLIGASPSLLSSFRPSLHHRSHKPSRRPFSPSPISQAQLPQTLLSIADLTSPTATDPSVSLCAHSVSIEKDQATPLALKSGGQYQLGLNSSVKTMKLCPLVQVSSVGTKTDRVSSMGRGCPPVCVGIGVEISVRWQWLCHVLWYRVCVGIGLRSGLLWCALVVSCFVVSG